MHRRAAMKKNLQIVSMLVVCASLGFAQTDGGASPDIQRRLEMIERGQTEAVRAELPALMTNFQNHPGVLYLQAILTTDGTEASKVYQSIVDNFPKSEWADDALFKLYQYYYSIGLYKTGDQKLQQLRQEYPFSTYAAGTQSKEQAETKPEDAPAQITSPNPIQKYPTSFTVQVGAFSTLQNADELRARYERKNYSSNIFTIVNNGRKPHNDRDRQDCNDQGALLSQWERVDKLSLESIVVS